MQPCFEQSRSLFVQLQQAEGLDLRDKRGQRHELAVVLVGVTLALLSKRDGYLSSLHRHMVSHYAPLMAALGSAPKKAISRAQLPRVLEPVAVEVFDELIAAHFGVALQERSNSRFRKSTQVNVISGGDRAI